MLWLYGRGGYSYDNPGDWNGGNDGWWNGKWNGGGSGGNSNGNGNGNGGSGGHGKYDDNSRTIYLVLVTLLHIAAESTTVWRFVSHHKRFRCWVDDYAALFGALLDFVFLVGYWLDTIKISPEQANANMYVKVVGYTFAIWAARASIAISIVRLAPTRRINSMRRALTIIATFLAIAVALASLGGYQCAHGVNKSSYASQWRQCKVSNWLGVLGLIVACLIDALLICIPIRIFATSPSLSRPKKILISAGFSASLLSALATFVCAILQIQGAGNSSSPFSGRRRRWRAIAFSSHLESSVTLFVCNFLSVVAAGWRLWQKNKHKVRRKLRGAWKRVRGSSNRRRDGQDDDDGDDDTSGGGGGNGGNGNGNDDSDDPDALTRAYTTTAGPSADDGGGGGTDNGRSGVFGLYSRYRQHNFQHPGYQYYAQQFGGSPHGQQGGGQDQQQQQQQQQQQHHHQGSLGYQRYQRFQSYYTRAHEGEELGRGTMGRESHNPRSTVTRTSNGLGNTGMSNSRSGYEYGRHPGGRRRRRRSASLSTVSLALTSLDLMDYGLDADADEDPDAERAGDDYGYGGTSATHNNNHHHHQPMRGEADGGGDEVVQRRAAIRVSLTQITIPDAVYSPLKDVYQLVPPPPPHSVQLQLQLPGLGRAQSAGEEKSAGDVTVGGFCREGGSTSVSVEEDEALTYDEKKGAVTEEDEKEEKQELEAAAVAKEERGRNNSV